MQELLRNAWTGWQNYTDHGKYAALLLIVLMFLWFRREQCKEKLLLVYTTIMAICCIFPITAAVLMKYQTKFYDYEWIWSYVPLTLMIAYGGVILLDALWKKQKQMQKWISAVAVFGLIMLCGNIGQVPDTLETSEREQAEAVVSILAESAEGQEICLWAPKEIMETARGTRGDIRLLYGRNIWDAALGAYFYESYGKTEELLYLWMCQAEESGSDEYIAEDGTVIKGSWCMQSAVSAGVNRILLPGSMPIEEIQALSNALGAEVQQLESYYLFVL